MNCSLHDRVFSPLDLIPRLPARPALGRCSSCHAPRGRSQKHPSGWFSAGLASPSAPHFPKAPELSLLCRRWPWRCQLQWHKHTRTHAPLCEYQQNTKKTKKKKRNQMWIWGLFEIWSDMLFMPLFSSVVSLVYFWFKLLHFHYKAPFVTLVAQQPSSATKFSHHNCFCGLCRLK